MCRLFVVVGVQCIWVCSAAVHLVECIRYPGVCLWSCVRLRAFVRRLVLRVIRLCCDHHGGRLAAFCSAHSISLCGLCGACEVLLAEGRTLTAFALQLRRNRCSVISLCVCSFASVACMHALVGRAVASLYSRHSALLVK